MSGMRGIICSSRTLGSDPIKKKGGRNHPFCRECDVMDAGERERYIKKIMREKS